MRSQQTFRNYPLWRWTHYPRSIVIPGEMTKVGNTIELIHYTRCTILVGTQVVNRNTPTILHYGDKVYIAFEDMSTELEIRFKNSH